MGRQAGVTHDEITARIERVSVAIRAGRPVADIAEAEGMSIARVYEIRRAIGIRGPGCHMTTDELALIESMLDDGASFAEVARTVGRSAKSLSERFRGRGWTRQQCAEHGLLIRRQAGLEL